MEEYPQQKKETVARMLPKRLRKANEKIDVICSALLNGCLWQSSYESLSSFRLFVRSRSPASSASSRAGAASPVGALLFGYVGELKAIVHTNRWDPH